MRAIEEGLSYHTAGRLADARRVYEEILREDPDNARALHLCGALAFQEGNYPAAVDCIERSLAREPANPAAWNNLGEARRKLSQLEEALACYDRALELQPSYSETLSNRGIVLQALERFDDALFSYDRALAIDAGNARALNNRGTLLRKLKRLPEALASFDQALSISANYAEAHANRAAVLKDMGHSAAALAGYASALAIVPHDKDSLLGSAGTFTDLGRLHEALEVYDKIVALDPRCERGWYSRGVTLHKLERYDESLACYERALAIRPRYPEALNNRGNLWREVGRPRDALADYRSAVAIDPQYALAHWNEALCHLALGDFEHGWKKYEWRWHRNDVHVPRRDYVEPLWLGEGDISGKTLLLHAEQGFGDTIQFVRYVELLHPRRVKVVLEVQPELTSLLADSFEMGEAVIPCGGELPSFDRRCPLMSLPLAFGTRLESIPARVPYLRAPGSKVATWRNRLPPCGRPRIGLAWAGRRTHPEDHRRSLTFNALQTLLTCSAQFMCLQKEISSDDASVLSRQERVLALGAELHDFSDTAALIESLDLVISVDSAVAHLAGALGKPVWILLPYVADWRWLLEREDSPWYPSARLFRQASRGDWQDVLQRVSDELSRWLARRAGGAGEDSATPPQRST